MRGSILLRALPGLLLWGMAGCELLVHGEMSTVHCSVEGAVGLPDCPLDQVCKSGTCVAKVSVAGRLGTACTQDSDCGFDDFCLDPAAYGGPGTKLCSRPCCSSGGCDPEAGFVCWAPAQGGVSFCLDAADVHRDGPGLAGTGASCQKGSDCRSGRCDAGACLDTCCSDTGCSSVGDTCQLSARGGAVAFSCAPPSIGENRVFFQTCELDKDCATGLCFDFGPNGHRCSAPCCSSDSCTANLTQDPPLPVACTYVEHSGALVRACTQLLPSTKLATNGQPCMKDGDCRSGTCAQPVDPSAPGTCTDACCSDASCGEGDNFQCRPHSISGAWALRCERK